MNFWKITKSKSEMRGLKLIILSLIIVQIKSFECPSAQSLGDCQCFLSSQTIYCYGVSTVRLQIDSHFKSLIITDGTYTNISGQAFGNATFDTITINDNRYLEFIDPDTLGSGPNILNINNNPKLGPKLLSIVKRLTNTETISMKNDSISEVPANCFTPVSGRNEVLKFIDLQNNVISKIASFAFAGLSRLTELKLDHNLIVNLEANSLTLDPRPQTPFVDITLNSNRLNLTNAFLVSNDYTVNLYVENTGLTTLSKDVFYPLLANTKNRLYANGNAFTCDCDAMKWTLNKTFNKNIYRVRCMNFNNREIVSLDEHDLCP